MILITFYYINKLTSSKLIECKIVKIITKLTIFKSGVIAKDDKGNEYRTEYAEYNKDLNLLNSVTTVRWMA